MLFVMCGCKGGTGVTASQDSGVAYWEMFGGLERSELRPSGRDVVVLSNIEHGVETSPPANGLSVRYVARGCENYRIGGRGYRLQAGQVLIAPHDQGAECEIRKVERSGTLGVCTLLRGTSDELNWVYGPLVLGADCSPVGALMQKGTKALASVGKTKPDLARQLIEALRSELPNLSQTILDQTVAVQGAKASTRFEVVRRARLAQAYLHATIDHGVGLQELAGVVGVSQFRLLEAFQHCFGETPASYHRKLRLNLALEEAKRRQVPICLVCDEFGFADASSFSHAYRRAFGCSPIRSAA
jgi:AraC-like DNA-binding protein